MTSDDTNTSIFIQSIRTIPGSELPTGALIAWDTDTWMADIDDVRTTAMDMLECAVLAETMMGLIRLGLPAQQTSRFVSDMVRRTGRQMFGTPSTFELTPTGSTKHKVSSVRFERGEQVADIGSDVVRGIAQQWLEIAEAVDSDRHIVAALRAVNAPDGLEVLLFDEMFRRRTAVDTHSAAPSDAGTI